jgi:hypothetical protein
MALVSGMVISSRFGRPAAWTPVRYLLLVVASAFGFLMLANTGLSLVMATGLGAMGALVFEIGAGILSPRGAGAAELPQHGRQPGRARAESA